MTARGFRGGPETTTVMGDLYVVLMSRTSEGPEPIPLHGGAETSPVISTIEFQGVRALHFEEWFASTNSDEGSRPF